MDLQWIKASVCSGESTCVEVALLPSQETVAIRNSTNPGVILRFPREAYEDFIAGAQDYEFTFNGS